MSDSAHRVLRVLMIPVAAALLAVAMPGHVMAQDNSGSRAGGGLASIEEIIVTARRRAENLQSVPIAISAFTGNSIAQRGAENISELARFTPNISIGFSNAGSGGSSNSEIYIRGIGQSDFLITTDPGVGLYVDDVYLARSTGTVLDFLDVERVEILRGPQGTLFGRNTIGGAISITSKRPAEELGGDLQFTAGRFAHYSIKGSADVPLSDALKSRHTVYYNTEEGYTDRILVGDRLGDEDVIAARSLFEWTPSERFNGLFVFDISHKNGGGANNALVGYDPGGGLAPLWQALVGDPAGIAAPAIINRDNPFDSSATGPNVDDHDIWGVSATLEWEFDAAALKSITAYRDLEAEFARDGDNSPVQYVQTNNVVDQQQFSQELQLQGESQGGALSWLIGAYYIDESATDSNDVRLASGLFAALEGLPAPLVFLGGPPGTGCADFGTVPGVVCAGGAGNPVNAALDLDFDIFNDVDQQSFALFTHETFRLSDRWSLSAGLRYTTEEKTYFLNHQRVNSGVPIIPPTTVSDDWNALLPKLSVELQLTDNAFTYVSAARGFKSGGFNGRPTTTAEVGSFDPEFVWAYEVGLKTELADRRAILNLSAFYYDYEDIQLSIVSADTTGNLILLVENAGTARTFGVEAEFQARPHERLRIDGAIGYLDAEYQSLNPGATIAVDNDLIKTPNFTANLGAGLDIPISGRWDAELRGDWSYRGDHFNDAPNTPLLEQEAISLFNARFAIINVDTGWEFALSGTNLSDERYITAGIAAAASFGTTEAVFAPPRRWAITASKTF